MASSDTPLLDPGRARFYQGMGYALAVTAAGLIVAGVATGAGWLFVYVPGAFMALAGVALARAGRALAAGEATEAGDHRARRALATAAACQGVALVLLGGGALLGALRGAFDPADVVMGGLLPLAGGLGFIAYARRIHPLTGAS